MQKPDPKTNPGKTTPSGIKAIGLRRRSLFGAANLFILITVLTFFSGCSPSNVNLQEEKRAGQRPLIWPMPPEPARIEYMQTISRPDDIGANKGFFKKVFEFLLGSTFEDIVKPYGVTVDPDGRLLVADTAFKRIHIFDLKKSKYSYIDNADELKFESPIGVATDTEGNIYMSDSALRKVFVFDRKERFLFNFAAGEKPTGIAVNNADKRLYVVDTISHNVGIYDLKGKELKRFGLWGNGVGEFNFPVDIFIDKNSDLYVVDTMNYKVKIFDKTGKFLAMFGHQGDGTGDFGRPKGIAVDREGNIYVADAIFDTVQIFDRKGNFLLNFGSLGDERGAFWLPCGLYIDNNDKIYVADAYNRRVQIFEYLGSS